MAARKIPVVGRAFNAYLSDQLQMWHDIAFGFLSVHEHLEHEVEHWTHDKDHLDKLHHVMHDNAEGAKMALIHLQEVP